MFSKQPQWSWQELCMLRTEMCTSSILRPGERQDAHRHLAGQKLHSLRDKTLMWNWNFLIFKGLLLGIFHKSIRENTLSCTNIPFSLLCFAFHIEAWHAGKIILKHFQCPRNRSKVAENQDSCSQRGSCLLTSLCLVSSVWQHERRFNTWNNFKSVKLKIAIMPTFSGYLLA